MKINLTDQLSNFGIIPGYLKVFDFIEETNDLVSGKPEAKTGNIWKKGCCGVKSEQIWMAQNLDVGTRMLQACCENAGHYEDGAKTAGASVRCVMN